MKKLLLGFLTISSIIVSGCYVYRSTSEKFQLELTLSSTKRNSVEVFDIPAYEFIFNFTIRNTSEEVIDTPELYFHFMGGNMPTGETVSSTGDELVCPGVFEIGPQDFAQCAAKLYSPSGFGESADDFYALVISKDDAISTKNFNSFWMTGGSLNITPLFVLYYSFDIEENLVLIGDQLPI